MKFENKKAVYRIDLRKVEEVSSTFSTERGIEMIKGNGRIFAFMVEDILSWVFENVEKSVSHETDLIADKSIKIEVKTTVKDEKGVDIGVSGMTGKGRFYDRELHLAKILFNDYYAIVDKSVLPMMDVYIIPSEEIHDFLDENIPTINAGKIKNTAKIKHWDNFKNLFREEDFIYAK